MTLDRKERERRGSWEHSYKVRCPLSLWSQWAGALGRGTGGVWVEEWRFHIIVLILHARSAYPLYCTYMLSIEIMHMYMGMYMYVHWYTSTFLNTHLQAQSVLHVTPYYKYKYTGIHILYPELFQMEGWSHTCTFNAFTVSMQFGNAITAWIQ